MGLFGGSSSSNDATAPVEQMDAISQPQMSTGGTVKDQLMNQVRQEAALNNAKQLIEVITIRTSHISPSARVFN
jgi:hypothetical protein